MMNAKQARTKTNKVIVANALGQGNLSKAEQKQKDKTFLQEVKEEIDAYGHFIKMAIERGECYTEMSYPGDEMFIALKAHFEGEGYHFSKFEKDEGYCIGHVTWVGISW